MGMSNLPLTVTIITICFGYILVEKPEIRHPSSRTITVKKGDFLRSRLLYKGDASTQVIWRFKNQILQNGPHVKLLNGKGKSTLIIKNATRSDDGWYRMYALNKDGKDQESIHVVVLDVPHRPRNIRAKAISETAAKIEWSPPDIDGNSPIMGYIIEKQLSNKMWTLVGTADKTQFKIKNLEHGKDTFVRISAINSEGKSKPVSFKFVFQSDEAQSNSSPDVGIIPPNKSDSTSSEDSSPDVGIITPNESGSEGDEDQHSETESFTEDGEESSGTETGETGTSGEDDEYASDYSESGTEETAASSEEYDEYASDYSQSGTEETAASSEEYDEYASDYSESGTEETGVGSEDSTEGTGSEDSEDSEDTTEGTGSEASEDSSGGTTEGTGSEDSEYSEDSSETGTDISASGSSETGTDISASGTGTGAGTGNETGATTGATYRRHKHKKKKGHHSRRHYRGRHHNF